MRRVVGLVVALSAAALAPYAAACLIARRWTPPMNRLPHAEVALVPGAYIMLDGTPGPHLRGRLELALRLWRAGTVGRILASGGHPEAGRSEPESMRTWLIARGVPDRAILTDQRGDSTYESIRRAQTEFGIQSMIICSQNYTLPRAVVTARLLGLNAWGAADPTALREHRRSSRRGLVREIGATAKMLLDVIRRPDVSGPA